MVQIHNIIYTIGCDEEQENGDVGLHEEVVSGLLGLTEMRAP
jgi:hypothetical protein